jgi:hypothetical protein
MDGASGGAPFHGREPGVGAATGRTWSPAGEGGGERP